MPNLLKKVLVMLTGEDSMPSLKMPTHIRPLKKLTERELIQAESEIGRDIFGPVPDGHRREFFNLDEKTWIWHEEYRGADGQLQSVTTRYEIQDRGVLKAQDGANYTYLEGQEYDNFVAAVQVYYEKVMREIYQRDPQSTEKLA